VRGGIPKGLQQKQHGTTLDDVVLLVYFTTLAEAEAKAIDCPSSCVRKIYWEDFVFDSLMCSFSFATWVFGLCVSCGKSADDPSPPNPCNSCSIFELAFPASACITLEFMIAVEVDSIDIYLNLMMFTIQPFDRTWGPIVFFSTLAEQIWSNWNVS
jgi:hypothetical protein